MDIKNWLHTILLRYYNDPDRMFKDVDTALQSHSTSLKPKMDTYTYNDGHTQLLLCLSGTLPITYRSISYNIPVVFWIPTEYPQYPPIPYVKPTANMLVREGKHGDKSGLCYHPYRSCWKQDVNNHSLLELITTFQHVFGSEPPIYTKPTTSTPTSPIKKHAKSTTSPDLSYIWKPHPLPPPPPLTLESQASTQSTTIVDGSIQKQQARWPDEGTAYYNLHQDMSVLTLSPSSYDPMQVNNTSNNYIDQHPSSLTTTSLTFPPPPTPRHQQQQRHQIPSLHQRPATYSMDTKESNLQSQQQQLYQKVAERMQAFQMDMSRDMDELLNVNRQLNEGEHQLAKEQQVFQDLRERFKTNMAILALRTKDIDKVTMDVNAIPDVAVDEVLSGTTVVYNQLLDLVAEDNAIVDTIYCLGKALHTECIDLATFMKCTRKLARAQFMKRAMVKKMTDP